MSVVFETRDTTDSLTVGIPTRDRLETLVRCVRSLEHVANAVREVIVVDDVSDELVNGPLQSLLGPGFPIRVSVIRNQVNCGVTVARNRVAALAETPFVLCLDDDTYLLGPEAVQSALEVLTNDDQVGVVAFAQAESSGESWPAQMQPSPISYPSVVPTFIGFAHMLRLDAFSSIGGYREEFFIFGEEKELSLRMLDAGYRVVYLPQARIAHVPNPSNRSTQRYLQYTVRNDLLTAIYNEPLPRMCLSIPARLYAFFVMKNGFGRGIEGGFIGFVRRFWPDFQSAWRLRRPLKWKTFKTWRELRRAPIPYNQLGNTRNGEPDLQSECPDS